MKTKEELIEEINLLKKCWNADIDQIKTIKADSERIDWLQKIMTDNDNYCEVFFAGLRDFKGKEATAFQIESNPQKFKTLHAKTIREVIDLAILGLQKK